MPPLCPSTTTAPSDSRADDADAALTPGGAQAARPPRALVEGSQAGAQVRGVPAVCKEPVNRVPWAPQPLTGASGLSGSGGTTGTRCSPAGISARRPEISRSASAQREVESAIMLTWRPMSRKYSDSVMPAPAAHGWHRWHGPGVAAPDPTGTHGPPQPRRPQPTGVDGGLAGGHRHVGGVGHQRGALHDALRPAVHLHGQLGTTPSPRGSGASPRHGAPAPHGLTSGKSRSTSDISLPRSPQPT